MVDRNLSPLSARTTARPDRRIRKRAAKVEEILRTTAELIAERGYHGISLEDVADRLDLAASSLYHYFPSKDELIIACLNRCAEYVSSELRAVAESNDSAETRLRRLIERQLTMTVRESPELANLFLHPFDWPDALRSAVKASRDEHNAIFQSVIQQVLVDRDLAPNEEVISRMCLYGALNYAPMWLPRDPDDFERKLPLVVSIILRLFQAVSDQSVPAQPRRSRER